MKEIGASSKDIIPENWRFPQRNSQGLRIVQIDQGQGFVAVTLPLTDLGTLPPYMGRLELDYIFSRKGNVLQQRYQSTSLSIHNHTKIQGIFGEGRLSYDFDRNRKTLNTDPDRFDLHIIFDAVKGEELHNLIHVFYSRRGILDHLALGRSFQEIREQEEQIKSPMVQFHGEGTRGYNAFLSPALEGMRLYVLEYDGYNRINDNLLKYKDGLPEFIILDEEGSEELFKVEWRIENGAFVLKQTHLPSQIQKTLIAPLRLDTITVAQAAFSQAPYPKDDKERLAIPWRDIPQIVGVNLSYSRPPPQTPKSF